MGFMVHGTVITVAESSFDARRAAISWSCSSGPCPGFVDEDDFDCLRPDDDPFDVLLDQLSVSCRILAIIRHGSRSNDCAARRTTVASMSAALTRTTLPAWRHRASAGQRGRRNSGTGRLVYSCGSASFGCRDRRKSGRRGLTARLAVSAAGHWRLRRAWPARRRTDARSRIGSCSPGWTAPR